MCLSMCVWLCMFDKIMFFYSFGCLLIHLLHATEKELGGMWVGQGMVSAVTDSSFEVYVPEFGLVEQIRCTVSVCVCVCEREREREGMREKGEGERSGVGTVVLFCRLSLQHLELKTHEYRMTSQGPVLSLKWQDDSIPVQVRPPV